MIKLTGLDNKEFILNADKIERLDAIPESVITLTNGKKFLVKESNEEIVQKVIDYKRKIYNGNFQVE
ncbi:MAG: flagellar FlbD family protein [Clostridium sp.]|jgi:flagellar protein FlbD|uniref:flagellar FlbD family protein n=1 Tax=Clostridium sp. TaxID=1506 RepID=UPI0025BF8C1E|nr:flagellar FlbD family protein [Clostridium sp.]MCH3964217.1 flagellar FlbD family protein [Clostridium sp.]MCI1715398.1 flagellar FlbD family protein [Clostridium sp.]MCI1799811.1 flagellar FlbD family protein [Clostridium sp.]MCI1813581.1 flagellar FlbD family protein [Clostridium sp.]MCI1870629.1 flagellar FlbD family protein [Clostridium sp.]